jgi:flagellin-like protein
MTMTKRRSEPKYRDWRRPKYGNDRKGVSEAIGTILLLAIAIILIGVVAVWVETVPEPPKHKQANLKVTYSEIATGVVTIDILHEGGDTLNGGETEISIIQSYPTFMNYYMDFKDSETQDLNDEYWDIGDHWNYTLTGVQDNAEFTIKVVDIDADRLILNEEILLGQMNINLPDLLISSDNITFTYEGNSIRKDRPVKITAIIQNQGNANSSAIVRFFDDNRLISSGGSEYRKVDVPYKYLPTVKNYKIVSMNWIPSRWGVHNINIKIYSLQYETNYANNYASKQIEVEYYFEPSRGPDLAISEFDIQPSKTYPFHGNDLNVTIIMHNRGDQSILPGEIFNVTITMGNVTFLRQFTNGIRARDSIDFFILFIEIGPGGPNQIIVELDTNNSITELNKENNIAVKPIQILPTILVVDDDNADSGKNDVAGTLMKALKGRGITFEYYNIKGDDDPNPRINQGPRKLKNFDIVIWVTGYEQNNTLTIANKQNLITWMDEPDTTNSLWLIGQDILNDTVATPGVVMDTDFAYQYLGLTDYTWSSGAPEILNGIAGDPITDGMLLNTSGYIPGKNRALNLTLQTPDTNNRIYSILGNDSVLGVNKSMGLRYHNISNSYKVVLLSFEITSISSPYDLSNLTYHVLKWFNYSLEQGYDFGVVEQEFSTIDPDFMDVIEISATIVNNGPTDEEVYVMFYYTDPFGQEFEIETFPDGRDNPQKDVIYANGGRKTFVKEWLAISVGDHNFRVMVDPYDQFKEIVEENNDFAYYGLEVTQLQIQYTILVVDDDNSSNNMAGMQPETTIPVEDALNNMGYYFVDYVVTGGDFPESGLHNRKLYRIQIFEGESKSSIGWSKYFK